MPNKKPRIVEVVDARMTNGKRLENAKQPMVFTRRIRVDTLKNDHPYRPGVLIGIPTTGVIRYEWHAAFTSLVIPTNWEWSTSAQWVASTIGYTVAQARNLLVTAFLNTRREWLFFLDHDVLCPPNAFIWLDQHMRDPKSPVISGLYYTKSSPAEPLIYRGRGTGSFQDFSLGEKVWCDGMGMGFTLLHRSVLEHLYVHSPELVVSGIKTRQVYVTPKYTYVDPESGMWGKQVGTEDLYFLDRIREEGVLEAIPRWRHLADRVYPFLVDTRMFCWHVEINGTRYPLESELPKGFDDWRKGQESRKWAAIE